MKLIITIEIKRTPKPKKKSPTQKPTQSNSPKTAIIINQN